jgi:hypothetical protein
MKVRPSEAKAPVSAATITAASQAAVAAIQGRAAGALAGLEVVEITAIPLWVGVQEVGVVAAPSKLIST